MQQLSFTVIFCYIKDSPSHDWKARCTYICVTAVGNQPTKVYNQGGMCWKSFFFFLNIWLLQAAAASLISSQTVLNLFENFDSEEVCRGAEIERQTARREKLGRWSRKEMKKQAKKTKGRRVRTRRVDKERRRGAVLRYHRTESSLFTVNVTCMTVL